MAFRVLQVQLSDAKVDQVNAAGDWSQVAWGKTYLDLTAGFLEEDQLADAFVRAVGYGLVQHTMTIDTDNLDEAFAIGNGMGDESKLTNMCRHKSMSIGDVLVDTETGEAMIVATFGFDPINIEGVEV